MIPFDLTKPGTVAQAVAGATGGGRYIAGGTTLIDLMREEVERPKRLIDITALPLRGIQVQGNDLVIGALTSMADCAAHPETRRLQPLVAESLVEGASPQLRNMATVGGNLLQRVRCPYFRMLDAPCAKRDPQAAVGCAAIGGLNAGHAILGTSDRCIATHPSDLAVALVALEATMRVSGPGGERVLPVEDLYRLPGATPHLEHNLMPGELIVEVRVPAGPYIRRARYLKVRDRASYEFAVVSVAAALHVEGGVVRGARIACGGVGTRPWRMRACERLLTGRSADRATFERAASESTAGARPQSGNAFKVELLPASIVRALELARDAT